MHACPVAQSCMTLCNPVDCRLLGILHGILQVRILEWVAIACSRASSRSRDWTGISCIDRQSLLSLSHLGSPNYITGTYICMKNIERESDTIPYFRHSLGFLQVSPADKGELLYRQIKLQSQFRWPSAEVIVNHRVLSNTVYVEYKAFNIPTKYMK